MLLASTALWGAARVRQLRASPLRGLWAGAAAVNHESLDPPSPGGRPFRGPGVGQQPAGHRGGGARPQPGEESHFNVRDTYLTWGLSMQLTTELEMQTRWRSDESDSRRLETGYKTGCAMPPWHELVVPTHSSCLRAELRRQCLWPRASSSPSPSSFLPLQVCQAHRADSGRVVVVLSQVRLGK